MASSSSFRELIRSDLEVIIDRNRHDTRSLRYRAHVAAKILTSPNVRVVFWYRVAHVLAGRRRMRWLAFIIRSHGIRLSGTEIHPDATIGPGFYVVHGVGVGIGRYAVIGRNCRVHLGSVIAPVALHNEPGTPLTTTIGDDVSVGTNAVVLAGVAVGDGAVIGANAVVMRDVEPYSIVSSGPARVVGNRRADRSSTTEPVATEG